MTLLHLPVVLLLAEAPVVAPQPPNSLVIERTNDVTAGPGPAWKVVGGDPFWVARGIDVALNRELYLVLQGEFPAHAKLQMIQVFLATDVYDFTEEYSLHVLTTPESLTQGLAIPLRFTKEARRLRHLRMDIGRMGDDVAIHRWQVTDAAGATGLGKPRQVAGIDDDLFGDVPMRAFLRRFGGDPAFVVVWLLLVAAATYLAVRATLLAQREP